MPRKEKLEEALRLKQGIQGEFSGPSREALGFQEDKVGEALRLRDDLKTRVAPIPEVQGGPLPSGEGELTVIQVLRNLGRFSEDIQRTVGEGLGLGFGPEIAAGLETAAQNITGVEGDFDTNLARREAALDVASPRLRTAGNVVGGIATGGAVPGALLGNTLRGAGSLTRAAALTGVGAVEGGIAGAGFAEPGERRRGAAEGAIFGAAVAPLAAGTAKVVGAIANKAAEKLSRSGAQKGAVQRILRSFARDELTPDEALKKLDELGEGALLADVGENVTNLTDLVAQKPGAGRKIIREAVDIRNAGQFSRIMNVLDEAAGPNVATRARVDFDPALEVTVPLTTRLKQLMKRPSLQKGYKAAQRLAAEQDEALPSLEQVQSPEFVGVRTRVLHWLKKGLDDVLEPKRDAVTGLVQQEFGKNELEALKATRAQFREEVKSLNQVYGGNLETLSNQFGIDDAFREGENFMRRRNVRDVERVVSRFNDLERAAYKRGVAQAIEDNTVKAGNVGFDVSRRVLQHRDKIKAAFGDEAGDRIIEVLKNERTFRETSQRLGGSQTLSRQLAEQDFAGPQISGAAVADATLGNSRGTLARLLGGAVDRVVAPGENVALELAQILASGRSGPRLNQLLAGGRSPQAVDAARGLFIGGAAATGPQARQNRSNQ